MTSFSCSINVHRTILASHFGGCRFGLFFSSRYLSHPLHPLTTTVPFRVRTTADPCCGGGNYSHVEPLSTGNLIRCVREIHTQPRRKTCSTKHETSIERQNSFQRSLRMERRHPVVSLPTPAIPSSRRDPSWVVPDNSPRGLPILDVQ